MGAGVPGVIKASESERRVEINIPDTPVSSSVAAGLVKAKVDLAKAEARLDEIEGVVSLDDKEGDICWMYDEELGIEAKVHRTLRDNVLFWQESGASQFTLSVIENGYIPKLSEDIDFYEEKNNKSYKEY